MGAKSSSLRCEGGALAGNQAGLFPGRSLKVAAEPQDLPTTSTDSNESVTEATTSCNSLTICIGDIHGNIHKLQNLWRNLELKLGKDVFETCSVIFLGDYCDRGPKTREVLEFLATLPQKHPHQNHAFIAGNHDVGMAAFLGELPEAPKGFEMKQTWEVLSNRKKREGWWEGEGMEDMHVQGRRWGGCMRDSFDSVFDSASTFSSYGVELGDRKGLLAAVPNHHKEFLHKLKWVHEACGPPSGEYIGLIAVHAGLDSSLPVEPQLETLRSRDVTHGRWESLSGRHRVCDSPHEAQRLNVLIISGHHGFLDVESKNRLIIDESGGWESNPLAAVLLPCRTIVRDTDNMETIISDAKSDRKSRSRSRRRS